MGQPRFEKLDPVEHDGNRFPDRVRHQSRSIRPTTRRWVSSGRTTRAGMPTTVTFGGVLSITTELAPTRVPLPTVIGPRIFAPAPTTTRSSSVGWRLPGDHDVPPRVTP